MSPCPLFHLHLPPFSPLSEICFWGEAVRGSFFGGDDMERKKGAGGD